MNKSGKNDFKLAPLQTDGYLSKPFQQNNSFGIRNKRFLKADWDEIDLNREHANNKVKFFIKKICISFIN